MSATKRIIGDYLVKTIDSSGNTAGNINLSSATIRVMGNLVVTGALTTVSSVDTEISDNVITLNYGETGAGVSLVTSGVEVDRGTEPTVGIRWNESFPRWEISDETGSYIELYNPFSSETSPTLGGNLNVANYEIQSSNANSVILGATGTGNVEFYTTTDGYIEFDAGGNGYVIFDDYIRLVKQASGPTAIANNNFVYHKTVSSGGSGLFINNTESNPNEDELVSKQRAIVYGLIL